MGEPLVPGWMHRIRGEHAGRPLFAELTQAILKAFYGVTALVLGSASVGLLLTMGERPIIENLVAVVMLGMAAVFRSYYRRTCAIYGSEEGLEVVQSGKSRIVPWSKVGEAEVEPWYRSYPSRMVRVSLREETEQAIVFFAYEHDVINFEAMRASYTRQESDG